MRTTQEDQSRDPGTVDVEFDQYVSYEDEEGLVICDRRNASAWIRCRPSDVRRCPR